MNLIEQVGGYYQAKNWLDKNEIHVKHGYLEKYRAELLQYRRQHNIFEVGDKVLFGGSPLIHEIRKFSKDSDDVYILGWGWTEIKHLKHATHEEIAAGRRL